MLFIPITIAAAGLQVARNATQRTLMGGGGPWAATLVRFMYGLPFSLILLAIAWAATRGAHLAFSPYVLTCATAGGAAQIAATAALLESMRRSGFALGTTFQQSLLPFSAIMGAAFFGDHLTPHAWLGIMVVMTGVAVLSWPKGGFSGDWSGAWFGLLAGACFAVSNNGFRQAALGMGEAPAFLKGIATVVMVQSFQTALLVAALAVFSPTSLYAAVRSWRVSLRAGFFGSAASACWFTALALAPAGPVRAVGVIEMPFAAIAGRRVFAERLTPLQWIVGLATAAGVVMAALG